MRAVACLWSGAAVVLLGVASACSGTPAPKPVTPPPPADAGRACTSTRATYAITPFRDKTGKGLDLAELDGLLAIELSKDPCVTLIERTRLEPIIDELTYCDPDNPDREQFDCETFAPSGRLMGVTHVIFADVLSYEPNALAVAVRAVSVETGAVVAGETVNEVVASGEVQLTASPGSIRVSAPAINRLLGGIASRVHQWRTR